MDGVMGCRHARMRAGLRCLCRARALVGLSWLPALLLALLTMSSVQSPGWAGDLSLPKSKPLSLGDHLWLNTENRASGEVITLTVSVLEGIQPETGTLTVVLLGAGRDEIQARAEAGRLADIVLSRLSALDIPAAAIEISEFNNGYPLMLGGREWERSLTPAGDGAFRVSRVVRVSLPDANKIHLARKSMDGLSGILVYAAGYGFDRKGDQAKGLRTKLMGRMQDEAARYAESRGMRVSTVSKVYPEEGFAEPTILHVIYGAWRPVSLGPPSPTWFDVGLAIEWQLSPK